MRYLIDGHNLIAALPDIDLADPHDEAKLVYKLRGFAARTGKKITVVFDGGLPGGISKPLSTKQVEARFASSGKMSADEILLNRIRSLKNPRDMIVVTSDQEITSAAASRNITVLNAPAFIALLNPPSAEMDAKEQPPSPDEVEKWLKIFSSSS